MLRTLNVSGDLTTVPIDRRRVRPSEPAAEALGAALIEGMYWLGVNAPGAREGDPEGVHHLRTTTRRLRTTLRLFRDVTEPGWADRLADEFKWLAGLLGRVRDIDVMSERLSDLAGSIDGDTLHDLAPFFDVLRRRHTGAAESLRRALQGDRYARLIADLNGAADCAPTTDAARASCREALPPLVAATWKRLRRRARALDADSPDEDFHDVRKLAKQARYAAEAVQNSLDGPAARAAARFVRKARAVQDVLGEHQDAVFAADELRRAAADRPELGPFNFAAGRVMEAENRLAAESRARFFEVWSGLDRKKLVRWLKP